MSRDDKQSRPAAFVAMKFEADHWCDKRYIAIREELEQAGFSCIRADEIKTSGPVVDEVCRLLREAELVVIDSSGGSHSVSYEIGYCHGIGRPADSTLLLRSDANFPFNYQHYRHRVYRDLRHLRRLVRDFLRMHEPLAENEYGYTFTFSFDADTHYEYIKAGAFCIFRALKNRGFSGRCECYSGEHYGLGRLFSVGVMLRSAGKKATPTYDWWSKIQDAVEHNSQSRKTNHIRLEANLCEMAQKSAMLASLVPSGIAEFAEGRVTRLLGSDEDTLLHAYNMSESPSPTPAAGQHSHGS